MNFVKDITTYLGDSSGRFTLGTDLTIGEIKEASNGIYARVTPSIEPDRYTGIEYHTIDFIAVNKSYAVAEEDLYEVYKVFDRNINFTAGEYHVFYSHALGQVSDFGRDTEGRKMLRLSVLFIVRYNNLFS